MSDIQPTDGSPWDAVPPPEAPAQPYPGYSQAPDYGVAPYGSVPGPGGYPNPAGYGPGYGPVSTNGMSIAALVCGICGFLCGIPAVLGIIFGFVGLSQAKRTGQRGRGMAIAGIVCGILWIGLFVVSIATSHGTFYYGTSDSGN